MSTWNLTRSLTGAYDYNTVSLTIYFGNPDFTGLCSFSATVPVIEISWGMIS